MHIERLVNAINSTDLSEDEKEWLYFALETAEHHIMEHCTDDGRCACDELEEIQLDVLD